MSKENTDIILKTLFNNYDKWEDGTEPDDDVTLIVLKRISSQNKLDEKTEPNLLTMLPYTS